VTDVNTESRAVLETRVIHDLHRRATALLADAAADATTPTTELEVLRDFVVATLHHHHESEDEQLWPVVVELAPDLGEVFTQLGRDHERLAAALDAVAAVPVGQAGNALAGAARAVRDLVRAHLDLEEVALLPVLRTQLPPEEWDEFARLTIETAPLETAPLMIALLDRVGTPAEVGAVLSHLSGPALEAVPALRTEGRSVLTRLESALG
jgi:hemerythrin-like domain-containing protein